jgi:hypothetical protein
MISLPKSLKRTAHSLSLMLPLFSLPSFLLANPPAAVAGATGLGVAAVAADAGMLTPFVIGSAGAAVVVLMVGGIYYALSQKEAMPAGQTAEQNFKMAKIDPLSKTQTELTAKQIDALIAENASLSVQVEGFKLVLASHEAKQAHQQAVAKAEREACLQSIIAAGKKQHADERAFLVSMIESMQQQFVSKEQLDHMFKRFEEKTHQRQQEETQQQIATLLNCVGPILFDKQNETASQPSLSSSTSSLADTAESPPAEDRDPFVIVTSTDDKKGGGAYANSNRPN